MLEIDVSELASFFGVQPEPRPAGSRDSLSTTTFEVDREDLRLYFSFSLYRHGNLSLRLIGRHAGNEILTADLTGLCDLRVDRFGDGSSQLVCSATGYARTHTSELTERAVYEITVSLDPFIRVRIRDRLDE